MSLELRNGDRHSYPRRCWRTRGGKEDRHKPKIAGSFSVSGWVTRSQCSNGIPGNYVNGPKSDFPWYPVRDSTQPHIHSNPWGYGRACALIHGNAIQVSRLPLRRYVAILPDPSRRYSEIYGDGAAGNCDCLPPAGRGDGQTNRVKKGKESRKPGDRCTRNEYAEQRRRKA